MVRKGQDHRCLKVQIKWDFEVNEKKSGGVGSGDAMPEKQHRQRP